MTLSRYLCSQKERGSKMAKSRIAFPRIGEKEQKRQDMIKYRKYMRMAELIKANQPVAEVATEEIETK